MKRVLIYIIIAIFIALVVQPNIVRDYTKKYRVPTNTTSTVATNDTTDLKICKSNATICIDPGYSGVETYADSSKISAKDLSLALAKKIGDKLSTSGYNVVYTRSDNDFVNFTSDEDSCKERIYIAQDYGADYLLSLQLNNDSDSLSKGYTIFTQNDDKLIALGIAISSKLDAINFSQFQGLDSDHYGNFPILGEPDLKSIFIEFGYLTNTQDYTQLSDEAYQEKIGSAIAKAFLEKID
ncbi:MAG: N-acetylmuramoyl-L-alanine amidase [Holdemanella sp.]|nr:N-acetylmuramoyl-L-alanine amidase [Holdemanella sp.]